MKIQFNQKISRIIVVVYILGTLLLRFTLESQLQGYYWLSMSFGILCLLFIWALVKGKVLNPGWF